MCQTNKEKMVRQIAKEDIVCYKIVIEDGNNLYTLYQRMEVELGKHYKDKYKITQFYNCWHNVWKIEEGGFHSYRNKKWAEVIFRCSTTDWFSQLLHKNLKLVECIIPKGTAYYEGYFDNDINEETYVSKEIVYKQIIAE